MRKITFVLIVSIIAVGLIFSSYMYFYYFLKVTPAQTPQRPAHCIQEKCIAASVFADLPAWPSNFQEVWVLLYPNSKIGFPADFSTKYPDENYWKQPEFYGTTFQDTGIQFYTTNPIMFDAGSGPYPSQQIISNIKVGDTFPAIVYWHAGWSIPKYQVFKLTANYPAEASISGELITQDPVKAASCFDVTITPTNLLLAPSAPNFYNGWAQKVSADITVKCSGTWAIFIQPGPPDVDVFQALIRQFGAFHISEQQVGGPWEILVSVS